jgi:putative SOS response-associated peptidase YedK
MEKVHNRMPVIIAPAAYTAWLNRDTPADRVNEMLKPYPDELEAYRVSSPVNSSGNDDPECFEKIG